jgi:hypothetical protein
MPFKWVHIFISIVPLNLIEVIEAPVPLIIGLLKEQFKSIEIESIEDRMWVFLDKSKDQIKVGNPILDKGEEYIYSPSLNQLKQKLKPLIQ